MGDFFDTNQWDKDLDYDFNSHEDGDDSADYDDEEFSFGAQHVMVLIDCHPEMFVPVPPRSTKDEVVDFCHGDDEGDHSGMNTAFTKNKRIEATSPFDMSVQAVRKLVETIIETTVTRKMGKRDAVGVLLFDTKPRRKGKTGDDEHRDNDETFDNDNDEHDDNKMDDNDESDNDGSADENEDELVVFNETNVHKLLDLAPPGIKQFRLLTELVDNGRDSKTKFCPSNNDHAPRNAPLQNAIEEAMRMFLKSKYVRDRNKAKTPDEIDSRSVWIFTNRPEPYPQSLLQLINNVANEAKEQQVNLIVWPLASNVNGNLENGVFQSHFYQSLASEWFFDRRFQSMEELMDTYGLSEIYQRMKRNRRVYHGPMHILRSSSTLDAPIMIDWFSSVMLAKRPPKVQIDDETKLETNQLKIVSTAGGVEVARFWRKPNSEQREMQKHQPGLSRFRQFFYFVDEWIPMTPEDIKNMLNFANGGYKLGLTILGFKPRDAIPFYHSLGVPYIIYPSEKEVEGSTEAFAQLHAAMLRKKVVALGEAALRESWQSRLVAIFPMEKSTTVDESNRPAGMMVITLPFEDDIRMITPDEASNELKRRQQDITLWAGDVQIVQSEAQIKQEEPLQVGSVLLSKNDETVLGNIASDELVEASMRMIGRMTLSNDADIVAVENDAMDDFYTYLKSIALDLPRDSFQQKPMIDESTLPFKSKAAIENFVSKLPSNLPPARKCVSSRKRVGSFPPDDTGIDWKELYDSQQLASCKVAQIKTVLKSLGEKVSGNKKDLLARLTKRLSSDFAGTNAEANPDGMTAVM